MGKKLKIGLAVGVGIIVVSSIASMGNDDGESRNNKSSSPSSVQADSKADTKEVVNKSQADKFKACVLKSGTPTEKTAAKHITKVTGADEENDVLDSVEVFTDYTGGMMGPHAKDGKLIASAFASCYNSRNGLVTVYDKSGEILSNGNF